MLAGLMSRRSVSAGGVYGNQLISLSEPMVTPFDSQLWCQHFKCFRVRKFTLMPGATVVLGLRLKNKVFDISKACALEEEENTTSTAVAYDQLIYAMKGFTKYISLQIRTIPLINVSAHDVSLGGYEVGCLNSWKFKTCTASAMPEGWRAGLQSNDTSIVTGQYYTNATGSDQWYNIFQNSGATEANL